MKSATSIDPRTPTARNFGTVISVNSATPKSSSKKEKTSSRTNPGAITKSTSLSNPSSADLLKPNPSLTPTNTSVDHTEASVGGTRHVNNIHSGSSTGPPSDYPFSQSSHQTTYITTNSRKTPLSALSKLLPFETPNDESTNWINAEKDENNRGISATAGRWYNQRPHANSAASVRSQEYVSPHPINHHQSNPSQGGFNTHRFLRFGLEPIESASKVTIETMERATPGVDAFPLHNVAKDKNSVSPNADNKASRDLSLDEIDAQLTQLKKEVQDDTRPADGVENNNDGDLSHLAESEWEFELQRLREARTRDADCDAKGVDPTRDQDDQRISAPPVKVAATGHSQTESNGNSQPTAVADSPPAQSEARESTFQGANAPELVHPEEPSLGPLTCSGLPTSAAVLPATDVSTQVKPTKTPPTRNTSRSGRPPRRLSTPMQLYSNGKSLRKERFGRASEGGLRPIMISEARKSESFMQTLRQKDDKIGILQKENEKFKSDVSRLRGDLTHKDSALTKSSDRLAGIVGDLSCLVNIMSQSTSDELSLHQQLTWAGERLAEYAATGSTEIRELCSTLADQMQTLRETFALKEQDLEQISHEASVHQKARETLTKQNNDYRTAEQDVKDENARLKTELTKTRAELGEAQSAKNAMKEQLCGENELLRKKVDQLEKLVETKDGDLENAQNKLDSLEAQQDHLSKELKRSQLDVAEARTRVSDLEREKVEARRREDAKVHSTEEKWKAKMQEAMLQADERLDKSSKEASGLRALLQSSESRETESEQAILSLTTDKENLSNEVDRLRQSVEEKENDLSNKTLDLTRHKGILEDVQSDLRHRSNELDESKRALKKAETQIDAWKQRCSDIVDESTKEKDSMEARTNALQDELADVESRNGDLDRLVRSMRRHASESDARLAQIREELQSERESRRKLRSSVEGEKQNFEAKIKSLTNELDQSGALMERMKKDCSESKSKAETLAAEIESMRRQLASKVEELEMSNTANAQEKEELRSDLSDERRKCGSMAESIRALSAEREQLRSDIETSRRQHLEEIKATRTEMELKAKKQAEWLEAREAELRNYRRSKEEMKLAANEITRLQDSLKRSKEEVNQLSATNEELQEESLRKLDSLSESHSEEIHRLHHIKHELEESLHKADNQRGQLEARLRSSEEEIHSLQSVRERLAEEKNSVIALLHQTQDAHAELQAKFQGFQNEQLETSTDSNLEEFGGLTKSELRSKCVTLRDSLQEETERAAASAADAVRRAEHVKSVTDDLTAMSEEMHQLIQSNGLLEQRLNEVRAEKDTMDSTAAAALAKVDRLEASSRSLSEELSQQSQRNLKLFDVNQSLQQQLDSQKSEQRVKHQELKDEVSRLGHQLSTLKQERDEVSGFLGKERDELARVSNELQAAEARLTQQETELSDCKLKLSKTQKERETLETSMNDRSSGFATQVGSLEQECSSLRNTIVELQADIETLRLDLAGKDETARGLSESLERQREENVSLEKEREEAISKLKESSQVLSSQKKDLKALELRATDSERSASALSDQVKGLQQTIKKLEDASQTSDSHRLKLLHEMENKYAALQEERNLSREEVNGLRDELRQSRRQASDCKQLNEALQSRIETMKRSIDAKNKLLQEARSDKEDNASSSQELKNELDCKQVEVDRLKAKIQMLSASIARMKADQLLLHEVARQSEVESTDANFRDAEISKLKSELHTQTSKMESMMEAYQSQQKNLASVQTLEHQLVCFIDDVLDQYGGAVNEISTYAQSLQHISIDISKENLNPGESDISTTALVEFRASVDGLSALLPNFVHALQQRREELQSWKRTRPIQPANGRHSPSIGERDGDESPGVLDALQEIKTILNEEVISPRKTRTSDLVTLDTEYLQRVIQSLENQIDSLLADLKSANDALKSKDQLFLDLEELVTHHESENDALKEKLDSLTEHAQGIEELLKSQVAEKESAEREIVMLRRAMQATPEGTPAFSPSKFAAGRLIVQFIERRALRSKAAVIRTWSCQTSALQAREEQAQFSHALLTMTREKLVHIKERAQAKKKNRRKISGGVSMNEVGLDRIVEEL